MGPGVVVLSEARGLKAGRKRGVTLVPFPAFYTISDDKMETGVKEFLGKTSRSFSQAFTEAAEVGLPFRGLQGCSENPKGCLPESSAELC